MLLLVKPNFFLINIVRESLLLEFYIVISLLAGGFFLCKLTFLAILIFSHNWIPFLLLFKMFFLVSLTFQISIAGFIWLIRFLVHSFSVIILLDLNYAIDSLCDHDFHSLPCYYTITDSDFSFFSNNHVNNNKSELRLFLYFNSYYDLISKSIYYQIRRQSFDGNKTDNYIHNYVCFLRLAFPSCIIISNVFATSTIQ